MKKGDKDFLKLQSILKNNDLGTKFAIDSNEYQLLYNALLLHPKANEKIGVGASYFTIENSSVRMTDKHFVIVRTDNSQADFSFYKCCSNQKTSDTAKFSKALRWVVKQDIDNFRNSSFKNEKYLVCPITGLKTTKNNCQVDHTYPNTWDFLIATFVELKKIDIKDIKYSENEESAGEHRLEDKELARNFYDFHKQNADLRIVYWRANLQQPRTRNMKNSP